ncbi:MAG: peptidoglycan-binding domain-containing protein, partial [Verrucomicrobiota bacterium]
MKKILHATLLTLVLLSTGRADDLTRNAQTELKSQGFYYGEINGSLSSETTASIKRFQIRNGLEVTGTLNGETLESLGLAKAQSAPVPPVARVVPPPPPAPVTQVVPPPVSRTERRVEIVEEEDRRFLDEEETPRVQPRAPRPPVREVDEEEDYAALFLRTPFASAPPELQRSTVRKAQNFLLRERLY